MQDTNGPNHRQTHAFASDQGISLATGFPFTLPGVHPDLPGIDQQPSSKHMESGWEAISDSFAVRLSFYQLGFATLGRMRGSLHREGQLTSSRIVSTVRPWSGKSAANDDLDYLSGAVHVDFDVLSGAMPPYLTRQVPLDW
ncbi:hypothetical protein An12g02250 [Aspergillus niger]|uniref:Uncharacterized protein n=2 Tax=Aspergillus niger TaxID=5061 RepID=A2QYS1_ASPNC|nr:hypothetical protein An12g02250 [Aspergillus niger]CAK41070.1 hypothetical protein An12g02250 [Aspergillus niger]